MMTDEIAWVLQFMKMLTPDRDLEDGEAEQIARQAYALAKAFLSLKLDVPGAEDD